MTASQSSKHTTPSDFAKASAMYNARELWACDATNHQQNEALWTPFTVHMTDNGGTT